MYWSVNFALDPQLGTGRPWIDKPYQDVHKAKGEQLDARDPWI